MKINLLEICNFRNLKFNRLEPSHKINIIYGSNGSGKTSFLEALHYLGLGRSFRTRQINRLTHYDADGFSLFSQLINANLGTLPVGIERKAEGTTIKIGGKTTTSLIDIIQLLPLQLMNADSHLLLSSGPQIRRQFLDWGVFHVEHSFYQHWQRATRVLKQRNAQLKSARFYSDVALWDQELENISLTLHKQRLQYLEYFEPHFSNLMRLLLPNIKYTLHYKPGWNTAGSLATQLKEAFDKDQFLGYTQYGPHRFDLTLKANQLPAAEILSQGQQKLATYSLRLAQGKLMQQQTAKNCVFLIDDLPSELDDQKRALISAELLTLNSQIFVTAIDPSQIQLLQTTPDSKMFHVEHGIVAP